MNAAARWIIERQENDGCWGGIQPPAVYSVIALHLLGYDLDHPVMRAGLDSLDRFAVWREDGARMIEACQSPVWDTCLATIALADAGLPADHPALVKAADWMLGEEIVRPGDWSVQRPRLPPGGWAFEFHNDNYPDIDDTAEVVLALRRVRHPDPERVETAIERGVRWNLGMQSKNGAWGAFDVDNTSAFPNRLPFCDFGEVIDPPSADVTAHVVEMLAVEGMAHDPRTRRGIEWLLAEQEPNGAWFGRWGVNYVYGTGSVVPGADRRRAARRAPGDPARRRLAGVGPERGRRLGRGPALLPRRAEWIGRGASTASQTAWALLALLAAGERDSKAVERGRRAGSPRPSCRTAPGTSRTSPAPASPGTSRSTTTSTGRSSRSPRSAATSTGSPSPTVRGGLMGPRQPDAGPAADRLRARHRAGSPCAAATAAAPPGPSPCCAPAWGPRPPSGRHPGARRPGAARRGRPGHRLLRGARPRHAPR